jgi:stearoyl-CoA desaturase (Delta-9 desaturase)
MPSAPRNRHWRRTYFNITTVAFWGVHLAAIIGVAVLGWSWTGLALALALYAPRMFFITAGNHRYFSHRSYRTSRVFQFLMALACVATGEKGVLWWAAHHRDHHRYSDRPGDAHSPREGFLWSHMGWILSRELEGTNLHNVKDLARYPELRLLEKIWLVPPILVGVLTWAVGGAFGLIWGYFVCQVMFWHATFTINSLAHVFGSRRFDTRDDSRNNWLLALITFGEGWHNNHHHRPGSVRQGFRWWEFDLSYYILRALAALGLVWDLRPIGEREPLGGDDSGDTEAPSRRVA